MAWYPTLQNGLISVTGRIGPKGAVSFEEERVMHGDWTADREGVAAGSVYQGTLKGGVLKGTGSWSGLEPSGSSNTIQSSLKFRLKLAK